MTNIIFDLEASCKEVESKYFTQEIIEIGAYKLDEFGEIIDKFQSFIQPQLHPYLSSYCTKLTTIQQKDVQHAKSFDIVIEKFIAWIDSDDYRLMSWGNTDPELLLNDCIFHKQDTKWLIGKHIDMLEAYNLIRSISDKIGFLRALELESIIYIGTPHRAIYDAANLVNLYLKYLGRW